MKLIIAILLFSLVVILVQGLWVSFVKKDSLKGNWWMRVRIGVQFLTIAVILLYVLMR